ncbi:hypothetical protein GGI25_002536 [Coemansia spiralis]|uniref:Uncharacterized protein n=2 Tax=Coemansia TaxID=4863 RepID=A0A9W8G8M9_9FUNG|nr:hypothetical protein EDC05_002460 [Coemansia umbellata]KAJ2622899.1 hypothetical protein GGI26_002865 [Coemansia sp. RSA 1358]KAJ2678185.1 hypothetical protein GGI25_002536 [Coemansia spiralis]
MAKKSANSNAQVGTRDEDGLQIVKSPGAAAATKVADSSAPSVPKALDASKDMSSLAIKASAAEIINKRLRAVRKKLQRAVASEQKAANNADARESLDSPALKVANLRAIVKELEDLYKSATNAAADGSTAESDADQKVRPVDKQAIGNAEKRGRNNALASEANVHHQTLRLVYAAIQGTVAGNDNNDRHVSDGEHAKLAGFFALVLTGVESERKGVAADEKLSLSPSVAVQHLRLFAQRANKPVSGLGGSVASTYEELASIVDNTFSVAKSGNDDAKTPLKTGLSLSEPQGVKIAMPTSVFVSCNDTDVDDNDFNTTVIVPPGGLTFIASAELVDGPDDENSGEGERSSKVVDTQESVYLAAPEASFAADAEPQSTAAANDVSKSNDAAHSVSIPVPNHSIDPSDAKFTDTERVGGFAPSSSKASNQMAMPQPPPPYSSADSSVVEMPTPVEYPANITGSDAPPAGFSTMFGGPPAAVITNWPTTATGANAASSGMPAIPGMYGMLPMHYMPHVAMQYGGFFPPHMYGMPGMNTVGGATQPGGMATSDMHASTQATKTEVSPVPAENSGSSSQQQVVVNAMPIAIGGIPTQVGMWPSTGTDSNTSGNVNTEGGVTIIKPGFPNASANVDSTSAPPMMVTMPNTDSSYQHAMVAAAAAAAAGFSMNMPFMYPHIDTSALSTAATGGGSENNDSVNSLDSASNRGGSSRPASIHHYSQQQHQQNQQQPGQDSTPRGLAQTVTSPEYVPITQYMWPPQQTDAKYMHNQQSLQQQQPPHPQLQQPPPQQPLQQHSNYVYQQQQHPNQQHYSASQGQGGYRRRGSGSNSSAGGSGSNSNSNNGSSGGNSNSGSGNHSNHHPQQHHHHYNYQRDRRGNGGNSGYQRQHRWNNNNSNNNNQGYNRHHQPHSNPAVVTAVQPATSSPASSHHAGQGQENTNFGATTVPSADVPVTTGNSSAYYTGGYVRQQ